MARYWPGRSLLELYRGEMSWRELRVFLAHLPEDSATARSVNPRDPEEEFWTLDRRLLATIADGIRDGNFARIKLHGDPKKTGRLTPPEPIQRPGVTPRSGGAKVIRFGGRHGSGAAELATVLRGATA